MKTVALLLILTAGTPADADRETVQAASAEKTAAAFLQAYLAGNAAGMKDHLADKVLIDGDMRFMTPASDQTVSRDQFVAGYTTFFEKIGRDRWRETIGRVKPTLALAAKDGEVLGIVKAGDFIYDLHFRESVRGERSGLDEAIVFVFREVNGKPVIVGHYADF